MKKTLNKKLITICALIVLIICTFTPLLVSCDSLVKKHEINMDEWIKTPYVVLDYGEYLGIYDNTTKYGVKRYNFYGIKDININEWLYGNTYMLYSPDSAVYKNIKAKEEPLYDWDINYMGMSTEKKEEKHNRTIYKIEKVTEDKELIQAILNTFQVNIETESIDLNLISSNELFFIFKNCLSLSYNFSLKKYEDGSIYIFAKKLNIDFDTDYNSSYESYKINVEYYDLVNNLIEQIKH